MVMKVKVAVMLLGAIFVIPTSMIGATLAMGKYAKQLVNCGEDATSAAIAISPMINADPGNDMQDISKSLSLCTKNADIRKGNITFIREEAARFQAHK